MRVRHFIIIAGLTFALGGSIWVYDNMGGGMATGAGGLPLIKANTTPIRSEPDEPGGEVVPHANSTVFAAMSRTSDADPSMAGLKLPETSDTEPDNASDDEVSSPEFAGLNTGFALRPQTQIKVESLFTTDEPEIVATSRKYVSAEGEDVADIVAAQISDQTKPDQAPELEEIIESTNVTPEPVIVEKPVEQKPQPTEIVEQAKPQATVPDQIDQPSINPAQAMEELEKKTIASTTITPATKPAVPVSAPKKEPTKTEQPKVEVAAIPAKPTPITPQAAQPTPVQPPVQSAPQPKAPSAPAATAHTPAPVAAATTDSGNFVIQLSSMPTMAEAERSWLKFQSMFPEALNGLSPSYDTAVIADRGTFYRMRAGAQSGTLSRSEANARCDQIRREDPRGGGCIVIRK